LVSQLGLLGGKHEARIESTSGLQEFEEECKECPSVIRVIRGKLAYVLNAR